MLQRPLLTHILANYCMSKRSNSRKLAMRLLYQIDVRSIPLSTAFDVLDTNNYLQETVDLAYTLAELTVTHIHAIDALIAKYSIDWEVSRLSPIDKSILRLGFGEINYYDTPSQVIINEMIELAKTYASEESHKFINGILGKYVSDKCLQD